MRRRQIGDSAMSMMDALFGAFGAVVVTAVVFSAMQGRLPAQPVEPYLSWRIDISQIEQSCMSKIARSKRAVFLDVELSGLKNKAPFHRRFIHCANSSCALLQSDEDFQYAFRQIERVFRDQVIAGSAEATSDSTDGGNLVSVARSWGPFHVRGESIPRAPLSFGSGVSDLRFEASDILTGDEIDSGWYELVVRLWLVDEGPNSYAGRRQLLREVTGDCGRIALTLLGAGNAVINEEIALKASLLPASIVKVGKTSFFSAEYGRFRVCIGDRPCGS